mgnify:CR=1 FL=1
MLVLSIVPIITDRQFDLGWACLGLGGWGVGGLGPARGTPGDGRRPGTSERVIPVPGWTTPGVIGLAAATVLLKAQQMVPGETTVVAGCGPLVTAVTASIVKGGGRVPGFPRGDLACSIPGRGAARRGIGAP